MTSFRAIIDRGIPPELRDSPPRQRLRARLCVLLPLVGAVGALLAAPLQLSLGRPGAPLALVGAAVALLLTQLLRWTRSLSITGNTLVGVAVLFMSYQAYLAGGLGSPRITALVILPMAAVVLVGWRSAVVWAALIASGILVLLILQARLGLAPELAMPALQRAHGLAALVILTLTLLVTATYDHSASIVSQELEAARREAEAATALKSRLVADVSHELRTPLNGIIGSLDLIHRARLEPSQRAHLDTIEHSSLALLQLIEDLLDLSRIEAGGLTIERAPMEVRRTLGRAVRTLGPLADERGLELSLNVDADVPEHVLGDGHRIRQVLINLVNNALRFTDEGHVSLEVRRASDRLRFEVRDTGVGIEPRDVERLFRAFEQAQLSTARERGGSGLGLDIAARLVELMGGAMHVDSAPGVGSTFSFELALEAVPLEETSSLGPIRAHVALASPRERAAAASALTWLGMEVLDDADSAELSLVDAGHGETQGTTIVVSDPSQLAERPRGEIWVSRPFGPWELRDAIARARRGAPSSIPPSQGVVGTRGRVLVVDDDPTNRSVAERQLARLGFTALLAEDGARGVQRLERDEAELLCAFIDLRMGLLDGFSTARQIRAWESDDPSRGRLTLFALTAHGDVEERAEAESAGFDGFFLKPLRLKALGELLDTLTRPAPMASIDDAAWEDLAKLARGDEVFLRTVVEGFLETAEERVQRLRDASLEEVVSLAHALKGSAAQVGAQALAEHARVLEAEPETRAIALPPIMSELATTRAALLTRLSPVSPTREEPRGPGPMAETDVEPPLSG